MRNFPGLFLLSAMALTLSAANAQDGASPFKSMAPVAEPEKGDVQAAPPPAPGPAPAAPVASTPAAVPENPFTSMENGEKPPVPQPLVDEVETPQAPAADTPFSSMPIGATAAPAQNAAPAPEEPGRAFEQIEETNSDFESFSPATTLEEPSAEPASEPAPATEIIAPEPEPEPAEATAPAASPSPTDAEDATISEAPAAEPIITEVPPAPPIEPEDESPTTEPAATKPATAEPAPAPAAAPAQPAPPQQTGGWPNPDANSAPVQVNDGMDPMREAIGGN